MVNLYLTIIILGLPFLIRRVIVGHIPILQRQHQVIHNYRVGAVPSDAKAICDNLIDLLEFMLQEETDLVSGLDLSKI